MGRRIRWMGAIMVACLGLVVFQLVNIQLVKAKSLSNSPQNPRNAAFQPNNVRGSIYAADGTVLAQSVPMPANLSCKTSPGPNCDSYKYLRQYPNGPLYAGITGFAGSRWAGIEGDDGIEQYYNSELSAHNPGPQNLSQLLFRQSPPSTTSSVTLTVQPALQQAAWNALNGMKGAVVALNPKTGAVLAMVSNPTYDPNQLASASVATDKAAYELDVQGGIYAPLAPMATRQAFQPGSTAKVVTSTAAYNLKPQLANFSFPSANCLYFNPALKAPPLCNDGNPQTAQPCGGPMTEMLPASCDPGYGELGIQLGPDTLLQQGELFGYNSVPGIDLPRTSPSTFKKPTDDRLQADAAIGQDYVNTVPLQNAMVAAGIANGGVVMTPHLMASIHDSNGNLVQTYTPKAIPRSASPGAAQQVTKLMESVVTGGTADQVGFPPYLCAAVKTGTAQADQPQNALNDDWMIGFAPANNPQIAIAVVVPQQQTGTDGAGVAGPIVKAMMQAALPAGSVSQPCTV